MAINVRALAAQVLAPVLNHKGSLAIQFKTVAGRCPQKELGLLRELCYGSMRFYPQLSLILDSLLTKPLRNNEATAKALALLGLYQLMHMRIPEYAAINETVTAAKQLNKKNAVSWINAILRRFQRQQDEIIAPLQAQDSYRYNHPQWIIDKLRHNWPEQWQQVLSANNQKAPLTLRVNPSVVERCSYQQQLAPITQSEVTAFSTQGLRLAESLAVESLPGFHEGAFSVQDEAAQLSAQLLGLKPNLRVLDACAAPGGKLCHIFELEPNLKCLDAVEIDPKRGMRIEENLERLGVSANLIIADAAAQDWWDGELYDRILLDAPCSATGVMRRNPDIKYLRQGEDVHALSKLQYAILENCWSMLKPGGKLLYATCSIFPQENERLIGRFIAQNTGADHLVMDEPWGMAVSFGRQLLPQEQGHDGFYYALLQKAEPV